MKRLALIPLILLASPMTGTSQQIRSAKAVRFITLDPGHFHAALVQKTMYPDVDSIVAVYAPAGNDLQLHLDRVAAYNSRPVAPTHWKETVYTGNDFFERMLAEKNGNAVVLSGNNRKKSEYILRSLQNGLHVFADKPMAIDAKGFGELQLAFALATQKKFVLYDIMTERFEITSILQRELSMLPEIFGELQKGSVEDPAVVKQSIHYFYKLVSGNVLTRPAWFFDASQQGEAIVDVMTHLVDLVQWECFPGRAINYQKDVRVISARHWPTTISREQFRTLTRADDFPAYLKSITFNDTALNVVYNGEINFSINGVHARTTALWHYKAPEGSGDNYTALMKGSKANLVIRQGADEHYEPTLYIEPLNKDVNPSASFKKLQEKYPGIELKPSARGWQVIIPQPYKEGHEEHFARVAQNFLQYVRQHNMPAWEVPNTLSKYFITTQAHQLALQNNPQ